MIDSDKTSNGKMPPPNHVEEGKMPPPALTAGGKMPPPRHNVGGGKSTRHSPKATSPPGAGKTADPTTKADVRDEDGKMPPI
jgi:hypothetical protein